MNQVLGRMSKFGQYVRTLKHLKWIQIRYRIWYLLRKNPVLQKLRPENDANHNCYLKGSGFIPNVKVEFSGGEIAFNLLNLDTCYEQDKIAWNDHSHGKLWNYNLCYFEYLSLPDLSTNQKLYLIRDFIRNSGSIVSGMDAYPISIRGINWIRFLIKEEISDDEIANSLFSQYVLLTKKIEYQVLGNHLLENAFSLFFAAIYFNNSIFYGKARNILNGQLNEQILNDGGHFELSPMYHQIILLRMLECIDLAEGSNWNDDELINSLKRCASKMLGWIKEIAFKNGDIPMVNDSAYDIAPSVEQIFSYALTHKIAISKIQLQESGYRRMNKGSFELCCDVGSVGPDYLPAHGHADSLNFILYHENKPIVVDPAVSTYDNNTQRQNERSTRYHNTVSFSNKDSSEMWGVFRVGRRAYVEILEEDSWALRACHDGYWSKYKTAVHRSWKLEIDTLKIEDKIYQNRNNKSKVSVSSFHFHPACRVIVDVVNNKFHVDHLTFEVKGEVQSIIQERYDFAAGYNKLLNAFKVSIQFFNKIQIIIQKSK